MQILPWPESPTQILEMGLWGGFLRHTMTRYVTWAYLCDLGGGLFSISQSAMEQRSLDTVSTTAMGYFARAAWAGLAAGGVGAAGITVPALLQWPWHPKEGTDIEERWQRSADSQRQQSLGKSSALHSLLSNQSDNAAFFGGEFVAPSTVHCIDFNET